MENSFQIQQFTNQLFGNIRVTVNQNGEPYFCLNDISMALGLEGKDPVGDIKRGLDAKFSSLKAYPENFGVGYNPYIYIPTQVQTGIKKDGTPALQTVNIIYVNEGGLYYTIFRSNKPEAIQFQLWVYNEVLPTMRKVGFNKSMQLLEEEVMKLREQNQGLLNNNFNSGIRAADTAEMRVQMIDKIRSVQDNTPLTPELKQYLIQYDPNWEG